MVADTAEQKLRAVNALGQASAHYGKICEAIDLVQRVEALEHAIKQGRG
jgi:hypothetical protein